MASVLVSPRARRNLERLIETHSLPASTVGRFAASIEPLAAFPSIGAPLSGRWSGYRFVLGPWRWMLIVYEHHPDQDVVGIVTVQDARSSGAATTR
ncbi:MAG TPA: type II toxin-antitoxin system RelE/ParE family toxin [Candidatus Limnocylindrales bacterium]|nr:type II toxin-antitoxin system RelE/ParE family toxin [Candidatus Limnocylindrales bacterium]